MSEADKTHSILGEAILEGFRQIVREEIKAALNGNGNGHGKPAPLLTVKELCEQLP